MKIELISDTKLPPETRKEIISLCTAAYEEAFEPILEEIGPSIRFLGYLNDRLVAHASYIERDLRTDHRSFKTAFIEAVAISPELQGRGLGSEIMNAIPIHLEQYDLAALSPSEDHFYARLGWRMWEGPLYYRTAAGELIETPDEEVMIYHLPKTGHIDLNEALSCEWRIGDIW